MQTGLNWLRIGSSGGLEPSASIKSIKSNRTKKV
jgi:hypothetical protein